MPFVRAGGGMGGDVKLFCVIDNESIQIWFVEMALVTKASAQRAIRIWEDEVNPRLPATELGSVGSRSSSWYKLQERVGDETLLS